MTSTDYNNAVRSSYGNRDYQITSHPISGRQAQFFNKVVDPAAIKKVTDEVAEIKQRQRLQEKPNAERRKRAQHTKEEYENTKKELVS